MELSGTLISPDQVQVSSETAGVVQDVLIEMGTEVSPGQVLVRLEPTELQLALQRAESALRQTEVQLGIERLGSSDMAPDEDVAAVRTALANRDDARAQLTRARELESQGLIPRAEIDTLETRLKVTEAAYQAALENVRSLRASLQDRQAAYQLAKKKVADASVRAPVGGAVASRLVQRGEFIQQNTPVATIVQINPLKLRTAVQEKYANLIRRDLPVEFRVESFPDETFHGKIQFISPAVEEGTRTFPVEITVANPDRRLKPGFFAKGAIFTGTDDNVMAIPEHAVSSLAGVSSVYIVENGVVRQQTVTLGVREGDLFEVVSGLEGNEILAASNLTQLVTGSEVITGSEEEGPQDENGAIPQSGQGRGRRGQGGAE